MKKIIICIISVLFAGIAQAAVSINVVKTTYDEDFNPTLEIEVSNTETQTLSNIVVQFDFQREGADRHDIYSYKYVEKNIKVTVKPNGKETVKVTLNSYDNYKYLGLTLEKARFTDGSIKTRWKCCNKNIYKFTSKNYETD